MSEFNSQRRKRKQCLIFIRSDYTFLVLIFNPKYIWAFLQPSVTDFINVSISKYWALSYKFSDTPFIHSILSFEIGVPEKEQKEKNMAEKKIT